MSDKEDIDINKKLEDLLFVEENAQSVGYEEGFEVGKKQLENGFHFGYHRGSLDIYNFPKFNDETVDILKIVDNIKFKYAKFCALTKISSSYPEVDKLDF
ncbi:uncharacterized protein LOC117230388 isoform X2 [Bombus vosnesenskii]|uniref:Uncharacterized protein LOC117230388 isoform X2 n=1 Tax=Bombus vosnesenskii TaxID=207650 RepID=A0A6J3JU81_9HYME|nr:uncharacterized protein LOC117230388 isoform X2 [Bombus vosnesenskii]XP_050484776.1 uncharacterized protein LOC126870781 isoform X2 [Bombus huntii]